LDVGKKKKKEKESFLINKIGLTVLGGRAWKALKKKGRDRAAFGELFQIKSKQRKGARGARGGGRVGKRGGAAGMKRRDSCTKKNGGEGPGVDPKGKWLARGGFAKRGGPPLTWEGKFRKGRNERTWKGEKARTVL